MREWKRHFSVYPMVIGKGKALFKHVSARHTLQLIESKTSKSGRLLLKYRVQA